MEKYPALAEVMRRAVERGGHGPLYRLASARDRVEAMMAVRDLLRHANVDGFLLAEVDKEIEKIIRDNDVETLKHIAQSIIFDKFSFFIL